MAKQNKCRLLVVGIVLLIIISGCSQPISTESVYGDSGSLSSRTSSVPNNQNNSTDESDEEIIGNIPSFPLMGDYPLYELDFEPSNKLYSSLDFDYKAYIPKADFFEALLQMKEESYSLLQEDSNYFQIGEYLLFFTQYSAVGPSEILLETSDGLIESVFFSNQPIQSMTFSSERGCLIVELANLVGGDGYEGNYYRFDMRSGQMNSISSSFTNQRHVYYHGKHYKIEMSARAVQYGEAYDVYVETGPNAYRKIVDYTPYAQFGNGTLYYLRADKKALLQMDLDDYSVSETACSFDDMSEFCIYGKHMVQFYPQQIVLSALDSLDEGIVLNKSVNGYDVRDIVFSDGGFYAVNRENPAALTLDWVMFDGRYEAILNNYNAFIREYAIIDGVMYFQLLDDQGLNQVNRYSYWKITLDGMNLVRLQ